MQPLISKLNVIYEETGDGRQKYGVQDNAYAGNDEFKRIKGQIALTVRDIREEIKKRDAFTNRHGAGSSKDAVHMSHSIRAQIKQAREGAHKLYTLQGKEASKSKGRSQQLEERAEMVDLIFKHVEECEALEKRRYAGKQSENRLNLFGGGGGSRTNELAPVDRVEVSDTMLPDIETQEELRKLEETDEQINVELKQVSAGLRDLRGLAVDMRDEVRVQTSMIDEVTGKVDKANVHIININRRMRETLAKTRSADRFILDLILLVVLLGIIGYIVSMF